MIPSHDARLRTQLLEELGLRGDDLLVPPNKDLAAELSLRELQLLVELRQRLLSVAQAPIVH